MGDRVTESNSTDNAVVRPFISLWWALYATALLPPAQLTE